MSGADYAIPTCASTVVSLAALSTSKLPTSAAGKSASSTTWSLILTASGWGSGTASTTFGDGDSAGATGEAIVWPSSYFSDLTAELAAPTSAASSVASDDELDFYYYDEDDEHDDDKDADHGTDDNNDDARCIVRMSCSTKTYVGMAVTFFITYFVVTHLLMAIRFLLVWNHIMRARRIDRPVSTTDSTATATTSNQLEQLSTPSADRSVAGEQQARTQSDRRHIAEVPFSQRMELASFGGQDQAPLRRRRRRPKRQRQGSTASYLDNSQLSRVLSAQTTTFSVVDSAGTDTSPCSFLPGYGNDDQIGCILIGGGEGTHLHRTGSFLSQVQPPPTRRNAGREPVTTPSTRERVDVASNADGGTAPTVLSTTASASFFNLSHFLSTVKSGLWFFFLQPALASASSAAPPPPPPPELLPLVHVDSMMQSRRQSHRQRHGGSSSGSTAGGTLKPSPSCSLLRCPICLTDFYEGEFVTACDDGCQQWFHKHCLFEWLDHSDTCPCCRTDMISSSSRNTRTTTWGEYLVSSFLWGNGSGGGSIASSYR